MKSILILIIALVVLLGITSSGTVGSFGDSETAADNQLVLQWEQQCLHGLFNVVNDGSNTDSVFMYDETGALLTELTFTLDSENKKPSGAASTSEYYYVLDQADKRVYRYTYCGEFMSVSGRLMRMDGTSSIGNPSGLAIDGDSMWVVVQGPDVPTLFKYSLIMAFSSSGDIACETEMPRLPGNRDSTGLAIDENYVYTLDGTFKVIFGYPRNKGLPIVSYILKGMDGSNLISPSGLMCNGDSIWVVGKGTDKVYQYLKDDLFFLYDTAFDTALKVSDDTGIVAEEVIAEQVLTDWWDVNATWEFSLAAENNNATGM